MRKQRRQFSAKFKFQVALEALKELNSLPDSLHCQVLAVAKWLDERTKKLAANRDESGTKRVARQV